MASRKSDVPIKTCEIQKWSGGRGAGRGRHGDGKRKASSACARRPPSILLHQTRSPMGNAQEFEVEVCSTDGGQGSAGVKTTPYITVHIAHTHTIHHIIQHTTYHIAHYTARRTAHHTAHTHVIQHTTHHTAHTPHIVQCTIYHTSHTPHIVQHTTYHAAHTTHHPAHHMSYSTSYSTQCIIKYTTYHTAHHITSCSTPHIM